MSRPLEGTESNRFGVKKPRLHNVSTAWLKGAVTVWRHGAEAADRCAGPL